MPPTKSTVSPIQGMKRRKRGAQVRSIGRPRLAIPGPHDWAGRCLFPDTKQTPAQARELDRIIQKYLRNSFVQRHHGWSDEKAGGRQSLGFSAETVGKAMGLNERQAKTVVRLAYDLGHSAAVELTMDVLQGMASG